MDFFWVIFQTSNQNTLYAVYGFMPGSPNFAEIRRKCHQSYNDSLFTHYRALKLVQYIVEKGGKLPFQICKTLMFPAWARYFKMRKTV